MGCNLCSEITECSLFITLKFHDRVKNQASQITFCDRHSLRTVIKETLKEIIGCFICHKEVMVFKTPSKFVETSLSFIYMSLEYVCDQCSLELSKRTSYHNRTCTNCHKIGNTFKKCGECKKSYYCSKECQKHHWPLHRLDCTNK